MDEDYILHLYNTIDTYNCIKDTQIIHNLRDCYEGLYLTPCMSPIQLNKDTFLIYCKKRTNNHIYEYYYCILYMPTCKLYFQNIMINDGPNLYLNSVNTIQNKIYTCYGVNDTNYKITNEKIVVCLDYYNDIYNFGNQLSSFITESLLNKNKYELIYNQPNNPINIISTGSYIQHTKTNSFIFGSGLRTINNTERDGHPTYNDLIVCAVRGPLTKAWLDQKNITVPDVYGDPSLLLPIFYKPLPIIDIQNKIGLVPHMTNYDNYVNNIDSSIFHLINPCSNWKDIINAICSCKAILSSSLHGLICADAYNIPNLWLDEYPIDEDDFKFKDYFGSQGRDYIKIKKLHDYNDNMLYKEGNKINLDLLVEAFPFQ
jgi:pyruvyltransferase